MDRLGRTAVRANQSRLSIVPAGSRAARRVSAPGRQAALAPKWPVAVAAAVDVDVSGPDRHAGAEASPETPYLSNGYTITVLKNRNPPGCLEIFDFIGDRTP
jgi:hypothetical protein